MDKDQASGVAQLKVFIFSELFNEKQIQFQYFTTSNDAFQRKFHAVGCGMMTETASHIRRASCCKQ